MKKLILLLALIIFTATPSFAGCDYSDYCPQKAYDVSSRAGQIISKGTGATFLSQKAAEMIIKNELKKAAPGKYKVNLKTYSIQDLAHGRFKSLKVHGEKMNFDGVYLNSLDLHTLCCFNYLDLKQKPMKFKENMVLSFKTQITNEDLQKTIKSTDYINKIDCINWNYAGLTFLKLDKTKIYLKDNKIYFAVNVTSDFFLKGSMTMTASAKLKVEEGNIVLTKVEFLTFFTKIDLSKVTEMLNLINPLNFSIDVLENKNTKVNIQTINMVGDKVIVEGQVFIPKNSAQKK